MSNQQPKPISAADQLVALKREMKIKAAKEARRKVEPFQFGFTSLLDALVVLMCFLLVSIGSDPLNIKMDERLLLPTSTAADQPSNAIPILVKKDFIAVDGKEIVRIDCKVGSGKFCSSEQRPCKPEEISLRTRCHVNANDEECKTNQEILRTMNFCVDKAYKEDADERSFLIMDLYKVLDMKVKEQMEENKQLKREYKGIVNIICDRDIPFRTVAEIVHTAAVAGLANMHFAIIKIGR